jgi:hypothetical protein
MTSEKVGNFPARNLLRQKNADLKRIRDPFLELEAVVREEENRPHDAPEGVTLTDFQVRLLEALRNTSSVSVSAPTSAGKSFTLELELLHRLTKSGPYTAKDSTDYVPNPTRKGGKSSPAPRHSHTSPAFPSTPHPTSSPHAPREHGVAVRYEARKLDRRLVDLAEQGPT